MVFGDLEKDGGGSGGCGGVCGGCGGVEVVVVGGGGGGSAFLRLIKSLPLCDGLDEHRALRAVTVLCCALAVALGPRHE
jgi:hypothetical protein